MNYVLVISPRAEAVLDEILERHPLPELLDSFDSLCEDLARNPVSLSAHTPKIASFPAVTGMWRNFWFAVVFRFLEDEKRLEILDIGFMEL